MTDDLPPNPALLPAGLRDLLPPEAEIEAASVEAIMATFAAHGYQRVKPPLLEFEETLLSGPGGAVAEDTFRLLDPDSRRMMALRSDTTPQVARIASTRLAKAPRPLRLSYAGQCLRVRGTQLAPERQVAQAGIELIGPDNPLADAEIILVGAEALAATGLTRLSFDLTLPRLVPTLLAGLSLPAEQERALVHALDRKDTAAVRAHGGPLAALLVELLLAAGPAEKALGMLERTAFPEAAKEQISRLAEIVAVVRARAPALKLTVDPIEFRGFRYHTGVSLTVYAPGRHEELGRGGRYLCSNVEPATGLTLFPDAILRAAPRLAPRPRVYVPLGADPEAVRALRAQGYASVAALEAAEDAAAEAERLDCDHILTPTGLRRIKGE